MYVDCRHLALEVALAKSADLVFLICTLFVAYARVLVLLSVRSFDYTFINAAQCVHQTYCLGHVFADGLFLIICQPQKNVTVWTASLLEFNPFKPVYYVISTKRTVGRYGQDVHYCTDKLV